MWRKVQKNQIIEVIYQSKKGEISQRVIKIYNLTHDKIFGYCYLRKEYRVFYKEQILALEPKKYGKLA